MMKRFFIVRVAPAVILDADQKDKRSTGTERVSESGKRADVKEDKALEMARGYLHDNAVSLYAPAPR